ncbi:unnamed protein product [Caenorhabditis nigoni]
MDRKTSQKDPKTLILEEFQLGKPIFESYKNLSEKLGSNFMDYPEFEFWWMRFSGGNFDLDYDRSQDPKQSTIEEISTQIIEKICGNLEDPKVTTIGIHSSKGTITLFLNGFEISYTENPGEWTKIGFEHHPEQLQRGNFRDLAIGFLKKVLAVPGGCQLQNLTIAGEADHIFAQKFSEKLKNHTKIHVNAVYLHPSKIETFPMNNYLNLCESIKEISIKSDDFPCEELANKIKGIAALKNVEMVRIHNTYAHSKIFGFWNEGFWNPFDLDIPRITLTFDKSKVDTFLRLVESLHKSPKLEYCHYIGHIKPSETLYSGLKRFGAKIDPENPDIYKLQIPNSDQFFEIRFVTDPDCPYPQFHFFDDIFIERKQKST